MDNQQQQQMNVEEKRPVGDILLMFAGGAAITIIGVWALRQVFPEWKPPGWHV